MVAGGREDRPRVRARKGKVPRLPRGALSTVPGHGDLEYSPLRRLALQEAWHYKAAHPGEEIKAFALLKGATTASGCC